MNGQDAASRKSILSSIFRRNAGDGNYTKLFDELDADKKSIALEGIKLQAAELPIIGSVENSNDWVLLTTERVLWSVGGDKREIPSESIIEVRSDMDVLRRGGAQIKARVRRLEIEAVNKHRYSMNVEPGAPYFAILAVLINVTRRNRKRRLRSVKQV
jgi:hypothetical protein